MNHPSLRHQYNLSAQLDNVIKKSTQRKEAEMSKISCQANNNEVCHHSFYIVASRGLALPVLILCTHSCFYTYLPSLSLEFLSSHCALFLSRHCHPSALHMFTALTILRCSAITFPFPYLHLNVCFSLAPAGFTPNIPSVALVLLKQVRVLPPPDLCASQQQPCPASYNLSSLLYFAPYGMAVVSGKCFAVPRMLHCSLPLVVFRASLQTSSPHTCGNK